MCVREVLKNNVEEPAKWMSCKRKCDSSRALFTTLEWFMVFERNLRITFIKIKAFLLANS